MKSASSSVASVTEQIKDVRGVKVLAHRVDNLERAQMRTLVDQLRDKLGSGVVVLGSATNGSVGLIVGVTKDLTGKIQAGKVIGPVAQKVGGKGGGRPDLAEAGGKDPGGAGCCAGRGVRRGRGLCWEIKISFQILVPGSQVGGRMKDRIRFISHKGKKILLVDAPIVSRRIGGTLAAGSSPDHGRSPRFGPASGGFQRLEG